jgi:hypothetical protein
MSMLISLLFVGMGIKQDLLHISERPGCRIRKGRTPRDDQCATSAEQALDFDMGNCLSRTETHTYMLTMARKAEKDWIAEAQTMA